MDFNQTRFANFAKYDLAINKNFYRNIAIVTLAGAVGIAITGFASRLNLYNEYVSNPFAAQAMAETGENTLNPFSYNSMYITGGLELVFFLIIMAISFGCWAHNLREKQGRIFEFTLPATNLEKFTWHALLSIVGSFLLCLCSLLVADLFNLILTLVNFGFENGISSLTVQTFQVFNFENLVEQIFFLDQSGQNSMAIEQMREAGTVWTAISFGLFGLAALKGSIYFFGNAVKYKYNIIFTYLAFQALGIVLQFIPLFILPFINTDLDIDAIALVKGLGFTVGTIGVLGAIAFVWWSYNLYKKAQITTSINK